MCSTSYTLWMTAWIHHPIANSMHFFKETYFVVSLLVLSFLLGVMFVELAMVFPLFGTNSGENAVWAFNWPLSFAQVIYSVNYL